MKTTILTLTLTLTSLTAGAATINRSLASIQKDHAKELLGNSYKKSIVSKAQPKEDLKLNIFKMVSKSLPKKFKHKAQVVTDAIIKEARTHNMDPYFVMAVIAGESSFNPLAVGPVGEIGLMQIRSSTGKWIAEKMKITWKGEQMLRDPVSNIKIGTAYLSYLREKFDNHGQLYIAAYNMGATSVKRALKKQIMPKDYPKHVMKRYIAFYKQI